MIPVALRPILYARGAGGAPTSSELADVVPVMTSYQHSISATGGFESCTIELCQTLDDALDWLNSLIASIVVYGPDAAVVWEGFLNGVSLSVGDETVSLSLDDLANAVRVRYQSDTGAQAVTATATDTDSIATYGRKELVYSGSGMTLSAAIALRTALLDDRRQPKSQRAGGTSTGAGASDVRVTLTGVGWYYALDWLMTSITTTATAATTAQVQTLVAAYNTINAFYSEVFVDVAFSGVSDTQFIEPDTPYREKIERLLSMGEISGQRFAWGVYEGRTFHVAVWAGASPALINYSRSLGDGRIYGAGGAIVEPWDVRPDAMYQVIELIDPSLPLGAVDQTSAFYVERVTCSVSSSGASVRLEPAKSGELDVLLARIK